MQSKATLLALCVLFLAVNLPSVDCQSFFRRNTLPDFVNITKKGDKYSIEMVPLDRAPPSSSVFLDSEGGKLFFNQELAMEKVSDRKEAAKLPNVIPGMVFYNNYPFSFGNWSWLITKNITFNPEVDRITFPNDLFERIMQILKEDYSVRGCFEDRQGMYCEFEGSIEDLPALEFSYNGYRFNLPASYYAERPQNSFCYTRVILKFFGVNYTQFEYNPITLGAPFMRYYLTQYNEEKNEINLYKLAGKKYSAHVGQIQVEKKKTNIVEDIWIYFYSFFAKFF